MPFRILSKLVLITCLSVSGSGCSYVLVNGPPPGHEGLDHFSCTESKVVPALDATVAGLGGVVLFASLATTSNTESDAVSQGIGVMLGLGALAVYAIPAGLGISRVNGCRAARSELARRSREAAERARLMTRADSAPIDNPRLPGRERDESPIQ